MQDLANRKGYKFMVRNNTLFDEKEKLATICRAKIIFSMGSADTMLFHGNDMARSSQVLSMGEFLVTENIGDEKTEGTLGQYVPFYNNSKDMLEKLDF